MGLGALVEGDAALLAEAGSGVVFFPAAFATFAEGAVAAHFAADFLGDDAGGDGDDGEAGEHDDGGHHFSENRDGCDIAIADGGEGDDGPVDGLGDVAEAGVGALFDDVHDGAFDEDEGEHGAEEDHDFASAGGEGIEEDVGFAHVFGHFEDAEHAQEAQDAEGHEVVAAGNEQFDVAGEDGDEVDEAEEAEGVAGAMADDPEAGEVFEGEEGGESPLEGFEQETVGFPEFNDAFEHQGEDAEEDEDEEAEIEGAAGAGVGEEDDAPEGFAAGGGFGRRWHGGGGRWFF